MKKYLVIGLNFVLLIFAAALIAVYAQDQKVMQKATNVGRFMDQVKDRLAKQQKPGAGGAEVRGLGFPWDSVSPDFVPIIGEKNLFHRDRNMVVEAPINLPPLQPISLKNPPQIKYITRKGDEDCIGVKTSNQSGKGYPEELKMGDFWEDKWRVTKIEEKGFYLTWDDPQRAVDEEARGMTAQKYEEYITKPSRQAGVGQQGPMPATGGRMAGGSGVVTINGPGGGNGVLTIGGGGGGGAAGGGRMSPIPVSGAGGAQAPAVKVVSSGGGGAGAQAAARGPDGSGSARSSGGLANDVFKSTINSSRNSSYGNSGTRTSPFSSRRK